MENLDTGLLLDKQNITLHREYFKEMVRLLGVNVLYKAPRPGAKNRDLYGEIDTLYLAPVLVGCIFDEHPTVKTMRKLGWNSELSDTTSIIHVPYDLEGLQAGGLFIVPSGIDHTRGRVFKIIQMSTEFIYPASIACEIGPVFESDFERSNLTDFKSNDFTLLNEEGE